MTPPLTLLIILLLSVGSWVLLILLFVLGLL